MSETCDRDGCEAARLSHWQCWDGAARSRCGSAGLPPHTELPADGTGGAGGDGGGMGGTGGTGGSSGADALKACVEMCGEVYGTCKSNLPGRAIEGSCVYACHAELIPPERVACVRDAACGQAEIAACFHEPGAGGSGGSGGSEEPPIVDRCDGIPEAGICSGSETLLRCQQAPGRNQLIVFAKSCAPWAACEETEEGAACVHHEDSCATNASLCVDGEELRRCVRGSWERTICDAGCKTTPYGAVCEPTAESEAFTGTILYEARAPNLSLSDWGPLVELPAAGLLVISYRGDEVFDSAEVQEDGSFSVRIPSPRSASDQVYFFTYSPAAGDQTPFVVAFTGKQPGAYDFWSTGLQNAYPHYWALAADAEPGRDWVIREDRRSAAIFLFQWMKRTLAFSTLHHGKPGTPILLWWEDGVEWGCRACFTTSRRVTMLGRTYSRHILFSDHPSDRTQWSAPVVGHELGHWEMDAYGYSPNEGGLHCLGAPSLPGLAWSEGWATFFSSDVRADARYWSKQGGTFFWLDLARMRYDGHTSFIKPSSQGKLDQNMPEEWIAGSLWKFSRDDRVDPNTPYVSLGSARMTEPPFGRGYTTKRSKVNWYCEPFDIVDTGRPAPMLADFLDALRCGGVPPAPVQQHFSPYPYPVSAPICD